MKNFTTLFLFLFATCLTQASEPKLFPEREKKQETLPMFPTKVDVKHDSGIPVIKLKPGEKLVSSSIPVAIEIEGGVVGLVQQNFRTAQFCTCVECTCVFNTNTTNNVNRIPK